MIMELNAIQGASVAQAAGGAAAGGDFGRLVTQGLERVNAMQMKAGEVTQAYAAGQDIDVHRVVMAAQEAQLAMDFTLQIRNKLIDAYQEVMRMQV